MSYGDQPLLVDWCDFGPTSKRFLNLLMTGIAQAIRISHKKKMKRALK